MDSHTEEQQKGIVKCIEYREEFRCCLVFFILSNVMAASPLLSALPSGSFPIPVPLAGVLFVSCFGELFLVPMRCAVFDSKGLVAMNGSIQQSLRYIASAMSCCRRSACMHPVHACRSSWFVIILVLIVLLCVSCVVSVWVIVQQAPAQLYPSSTLICNLRVASGSIICHIYKNMMYYTVVQAQSYTAVRLHTKHVELCTRVILYLVYSVL